MTTATKPMQDNNLAPADRARPKGVAGELQALLVDLIEMGLQAKQAHWNVTGPLFRPLHEQFDAIYSEFGAWQDDVAERIVAVGAPADGRSGTVVQQRTVADFPAGFIADRTVADLYLERLDTLIRHTRGRLDTLEQDLVSQDLVIGILHGLEKQRWMVRALTS